MKLMVCSQSTKKYADKYYHDEIYLVKTPPTKEILKLKDKYDDVIAIGGGSVIDTAKILCKNDIQAIPTTYAGASGTSHAVYWDGDTKCNIDTKLPRTILFPEYINLKKEMECASKIDCLCHIIESMASPKSTYESLGLCNDALKNIREGDWLYASILAGNAIEITGTNLIHGLSYGLSGKYNLPHGISLSHILNLSSNYKKVNELL